MAYQRLVYFIIRTVLFTVLVFLSNPAVTWRGKGFFVHHHLQISKQAGETLKTIPGPQNELCRTSDDEVSLDGLYQGQGVDLDRPPLPLLDVGTVRVSLQLALELVGVEKLESLGASVETNGNQIKNGYGESENRSDTRANERDGERKKPQQSG